MQNLVFLCVLFPCLFWERQLKQLTQLIKVIIEKQTSKFNVPMSKVFFGVFPNVT